MPLSGRPRQPRLPQQRTSAFLATEKYRQLDGTFVVGLPILAAKSTPGQATLAGGIALALRYVAEIALGPPGGAIADRWGARGMGRESYAG